MQNIISQGGDDITDVKECDATLDVNGVILTCCRSDHNHMKKGLWHRKGRLYW